MQPFPFHVITTPALSKTTPPHILGHANPFALASNLWQHRELIAQFTVREVEGRYRGSLLGVLWSFASPMLMLAIYTFVFGLVFRSRWQSAHAESLGEFALVAFSGLIAFNLFSECVSRAAGLIVAVPNYVKKVVFPLEILPVSTLGSALFHALVSLTVLFCAMLVTGVHFSPTLLLLPAVALPLVLLTLGLTWFLAGFGVFVRDIQHLVALVLQILFFSTPIFYALEMVPEPFRKVVTVNPLTPVVENFRRVILWGLPPRWLELVAWTLAGAIVLILGYAWFMRTKKAFADVI